MSTEPAPRSPRYLSLDVWRGVACLLVVVFHSTLYATASTSRSLADWLITATSRCWIGVPMFFVISGYCIAAAADSHRRNHRPALRYFMRRFQRIYPPFWICLGLTAVVVGLTETVSPGFFQDGNHPIVAPWTLGPVQWLGNVSLTEIWRWQLVGPPANSELLGQMWTLCYEEQFYLVVGIALLTAPKRLFPLMLAVTIWVYWNSWSLHPRAVAQVTTQIIPYQLTAKGLFWNGYWLDFAWGILVYYVLNYATGSQTRGWPVVALLFALPLFLPAGKLFDHVAKPQQYRLAATVFALCIIALKPWDATIAKSRWTRPLSWCGEMCYSLYLVHWPVCKAISRGMQLAGWTSPEQTLSVTLPLCLAASIAVAAMFYRLVESRFLNRPQ